MIDAKFNHIIISINISNDIRPRSKENEEDNFITQVIVNNNVKSISEYTCSKWKALKWVIFKEPYSLKSIDKFDFYQCSSLKQISIPSSVTQIGYSAFSECSSLEQILIPNSVTKISNLAFCGCSSLKQITIPSSVTEIGSSAFKNCISLIQVSIFSSKIQIEPKAFDGCSSLKQITCPIPLKKSYLGIPSSTSIIIKK